MPRRFHIIGDRTERLFSKAQKLLKGWFFEQAIEAFDRAIETDPSYGHIYLYKGQALAELGLYNEALVEVQKGAQLEINNFVFPMCLGCIHFDEGQLDAAQLAFDKALSLAKTNHIIVSYQMLIAFVKGERSVLSPLSLSVRSLPDSFKSRLLVAIGLHERIVYLFTPKPLNESRGTIFGGWLRQIRLPLLEWRVKRLLRGHKYQQALKLLRAERVASPTLLTLEQETMAQLENDLRDQLKTIEKKFASARRKQTKHLEQEREKQRGLLLELAYLYAPDDPKRNECLNTWMESFREERMPDRLKNLASEILAEMADFARIEGRLDHALSLCKESRAMGTSEEVDWVEGLAFLENGNRRTARRLFERFARNRPLQFNARAVSILELGLAHQEVRSNS
jgi:tetratricopeptide (TPR) repeat protein